MPPETTPPITLPQPEPYKFNFWETDPKRNFAPWFLKFCLVLITVGIVLTGFLKYQAYQSYKTSLSLVTTSTDEFAGWQTYRNEEYGFEFKYPGDLTVIPVPNLPRQFRVYDPNYVVAAGAVGQEVRNESREIKIVVEDSSEAALTSSTTSTTLTLVGPVFNATFHSGKYIYKFETVSAHKNLAKQIISTFKFFQPASNQQTSKGILKGHATIGPNCPVEREGVPCLPSPEAYTSRYIIIYKADGKTEVARKNFDTTGNYQIELAPGTYIIKTLSGINFYASKTVEIKANQTTTLDFDIDTGIR